MGVLEKRFRGPKRFDRPLKRFEDKSSQNVSATEEFKFVSSKNVECFFQHFFLGVLSRFHSVACRNCKTPADSGVLSKFGCVLVHKTSLLLGL